MIFFYVHFHLLYATKRCRSFSFISSCLKWHQIVGNVKHQGKWRMGMVSLRLTSSEYCWCQSFPKCASILNACGCEMCVVPNNQKCSSNYTTSFQQTRGWCSCDANFTLDLFGLPQRHKKNKEEEDDDDEDDDDNDKANHRRESELKYFIRLARTKRNRQCQQTRYLFSYQKCSHFFFSILKIIFIMLIHITLSNAFLSLSHGTRDIILNVNVLDFVWVSVDVF